MQFGTHPMTLKNAFYLNASARTYSSESLSASHMYGARRIHPVYLGVTGVASVASVVGLFASVVGLFCLYCRYIWAS